MVWSHYLAWPGLVKLGMWISLLETNESQCSPVVQFSPKCNPVVKTLDQTWPRLVMKLSEWRLFPANIMSRPVS